MNAMHVADQVARRAREVLALPLIHVGPDRVPIAAGKLRVDIGQRLHVVVAGRDVAQRMWGIAQCRIVDFSRFPCGERTDVDTEERRWCTARGPARGRPRLRTRVATDEDEHAPRQWFRAHRAGHRDRKPHRRPIAATGASSSREQPDNNETKESGAGGVRGRDREGSRHVRQYPPQSVPWRAPRPGPAPQAGRRPPLCLCCSWLFTTRYSLFATRYSLLAIRILFATRYSLLAIRHSLFATRYSPPAAPYPLLAVAATPQRPPHSHRLSRRSNRSIGSRARGRAL